MDNLDHTFDSRLREEFGQLDVRFNDAHWARMDSALSAQPPLTFFQKHRRVILILFLLLIASAILLIIYMPGTENAKRYSPVKQKLSPPAINRNKAQTHQINLSKKNAEDTQASSDKKSTATDQQSATLVTALPAADSMRIADSISAKRKTDSLEQLKKKKKVHLIW